jgi:hypothetical protein
MKRRSKVSGKAVKAGRRKAAVRRRGNAPKSVHGRGTPASDQDTGIARVIREHDQALKQLSESLEQQTVTSEVLRVIARRPTSLRRYSRPCWAAGVGAPETCRILYAGQFISTDSGQPSRSRHADKAGEP